MAISDPAHWIEPYKHKGVKYDKIVEIIAAINAHLALGSANIKKWPLSFGPPYIATTTPYLYTDSDGDYWGFTVNGAFTVSGWDLIKPTTSGSLKLYITNLYLALNAADGTNYVTAVYIYGISNTSKTQLYTDPTDRTASGEYNYSFSAVDCSSYHRVRVALQVQLASATVLKISNLSISGYYAT